MTPRDRARRVRLLVMDVDGTLTDGTLWVMPDGEEVKGYHVRDGLGILLAKMAGLTCAIITGKSSVSVTKRAEKLKIAETHQGIMDKKERLAVILQKHELSMREAAFIGDDLGDLEVIRSVGFAGAPADADPAVKRHCHFVSKYPGGRGAVREFIEFILKAQGKWRGVESRAHEIKSFEI
ncbi:MAG TPA: HAD hydrolase family protein [Candidatus Aminicenantes bacterium]|nr:HAD hydrolase family protein [Acidobacteriota bacterium]HOI44692.1 HAD hydrolase family protein [Candidatus Aminicenantes bacterium]